jgi:hypothetical protein
MLQAWQEGRMAPGEVHSWAEERYAAPAFEPEDEVANEILGCLDMLDINLTTVEDVPVLLEALDVSAGNVTAAQTLLSLHAEAIDVKARRRSLAGDPLYAPFCGEEPGDGS